MDDDSRLSCIVVIALMLLAAYFAVAETALASVSRNRIRMAADRGDNRAKKTLYLLDHFDDTISTILIGTNITHISIATLVTVTVTRLWGISVVSVSTIITTIVVFFVGEMLPKSIAKKRSEDYALSCAGLISFFVVLFRPLARLLTMIGQAAASLTKGDPAVSVTEDELFDIIEDMAEEGSIDETQEDIISSAIQFSEVQVNKILTPRADVVAIDIDEDPQAIFEQIKTTGHSRLPVYEGTIDNIIGMVRIRRYLKEYLKKGRIPELRPLLDKVYYAPEDADIDDLLAKMSEFKINMAIITDQYGGTLGIVTIEDILEEIVGEIWDEDDVVEEEKPQEEEPDDRVFLLEPKSHEEGGEES